MTDSYEIVMKRLPEHEQGFEAAVIYDDGIGDEQLDAGQPCKSKYGAGEEVAIPHRSRTR